MANVIFSIKFNAFVNCYFNVESVDALNVEFLKECGFDSEYFNIGAIGENIHTENDLLSFLVDNYNKTAVIEIVPDKFNEFAHITIGDNTIILQFDESNDLIASIEKSCKLVETYNGFKIYECTIGENTILSYVLVKCAIFPEYPEYFAYFADVASVKNWLNRRG